MTKAALTITATDRKELTAEQKNLKSLRNLATSLATLDESQIISGLDFKQELNLIAVQKDLKKEDALRYNHMSGYKDKDLLFKVILAAITWFVEGFKEGAKMRTSDIYRFGLFIAEYKHDSLEDILLCFRMAEAEELRDPETGQKIKRYASMSYELLQKYWHSYLNSKAQLREEVYRNEKHRLSGGDYRTEEDTQIKKLEQNNEFMKDFNAATGQVKRWSDDNVTPLQSVVKQKFKHLGQ